jgi:hypothetical protein
MGELHRKYCEATLKTAMPNDLVTKDERLTTKRKVIPDCIKQAEKKQFGKKYSRMGTDSGGFNWNNLLGDDHQH